MSMRVYSNYYGAYACLASAYKQYLLHRQECALPGMNGQCPAVLYLICVASLRML